MNAPSPIRPSQEAQVQASGGSIHEFRKATRKMQWWYEALADHMIAHPTISQGELATHFGRSPVTISTVVNTDSFKAYFNQRRRQHEQALDSEVRRKLFKLADKSLDQMLETLEKKRDSVPIDSLQRASDMALKNLGYGAGAPGAGVTVNVGGASPAPTINVAVSLDDLERAREALRRQQLAPPTIDAEFTEVDDQSHRDDEATPLSPVDRVNIEDLA